MKRIAYISFLALLIGACGSPENVGSEGSENPSDSIAQAKNDSIKKLQLERIKEEKLRNPNIPK
ncbi:MAG: hypothetical protein SchgKO_02390 [Schleiferiaceae bacterium]